MPVIKEEGSWRDTLFVWSGTLRLSEAKAEWSGSWVGCENCPDTKDAKHPSADDFADSKMAFDVTGHLEEARERGETLHCLQLEHGGWDLASGDDDDAVQRHGDAKHTIVLPTIQPSEATGKRLPIAAVGGNDFGYFVSAGYMEANSDSDLHLTLARRYLAEGDVRSKWTAKALLAKINDSTSSESAAPDDDTPWKTNELHAQLRKKQRGKRKAPSK